MHLDYIKQGDCLELMKEIPDGSIDMVLCDLPYETTSCEWDVIIPFEDFVTVDNRVFAFSDYLFYSYQKGVPYQDAVTFFEANKCLGLWSHYKRIIKENGAIVLFGVEPFSTTMRKTNLSMFKYDIIWEKERLTNINQVKRRVGKTVENISVFYKKQCTYNPQMIKYEGKPRSNKVKHGKLGMLTDEQEKKVFEYKDTGWRYPTQVWKYQRDCLTSNLHPTQKPLLLCEDLIKTFSNEGDVVLDNCMGSGTTCVACINTGRHYIGFELNEQYFDVARNRIESHKITLV